MLRIEGDPFVPRKWHTAIEDTTKVWIFGGKSEKSQQVDIIEIFQTGISAGIRYLWLVYVPYTF